MRSIPRARSNNEWCLKGTRDRLLIRLTAPIFNRPQTSLIDQYTTSARTALEDAFSCGVESVAHDVYSENTWRIKQFMRQLKANPFKSA